MSGSFENNLYEKILESDNIQKENFIKIIEEEIDNYTNDNLSEIGMGIYHVINKKRNCMSDTNVLDLLIKICEDLINKSPECAIEFSKRLGEYCG